MDNASSHILGPRNVYLQLWILTYLFGLIVAVAERGLGVLKIKELLK